MLAQPFEKFTLLRNPKLANKQYIILLLLFHREFFVHLVFSPTYALIKILSQAITLIAQFTPTCFDPYGSSSGSTAGPS